MKSVRSKIDPFWRYHNINRNIELTEEEIETAKTTVKDIPTIYFDMLDIVRENIWCNR